MITATFEIQVEIFDQTIGMYKTILIYPILGELYTKGRWLWKYNYVRFKAQDILAARCSAWYEAQAYQESNKQVKICLFEDTVFSGYTTLYTTKDGWLHTLNYPYKDIVYNLTLGTRVSE